MILILSYNEYEQGTDPVIDWLIYKKADYIKITIKDIVNNKNKFLIDINNKRLLINDIDYTDRINVIWYRRFEAHLGLQVENTNHIHQINHEIKYEVEDTIQFLKRVFDNKVWMPHYNSISLKKPEVTLLSEQFGLRTPKSIITNNKSDLIKFKKTIDNELVIKPIRHSSYFIEDDYAYSIYTQKLNNLSDIPEQFNLTLFQECIERKYEIRVFYLDGKFYSTAILVNNDTENIDIKKYFKSEIINWVPYQLPPEYEAQLDDFMRSINLNTGSLDVIKTQDGEYIMLEINPVGQYSAPGFRCNYYLDEKIADWLIKNDEKETISI